MGLMRIGRGGGAGVGVEGVLKEERISGEGKQLVRRSRDSKQATTLAFYPSA
jgi:hypothetical protein